MHSFDTSFFFILNSLAGKTERLDFFVVFFASFLPYLFVASMLTFVLAHRNWIQKIQNRFMVVEAFAAGIVSRFVITELIRIFYSRPRPFEILENAYQLIEHSAGVSFPSGHATFFFALATVIFLHYKKIGLLFFAASVLLTLARVAGGIHWPTDIFVGSAIGIAVSLLIHHFERHTPISLKEKFINFCRNA